LKANGGVSTVARIVINLFGEFTVTVDDRRVGTNHWTRRHAAGLVKVLSLSPGRRLHREHVIDLLWPDNIIEDNIIPDNIIEKAVPKLHKAAHFGRKAIDAPDAIVLRDKHVHLCPDHDVVIDVATLEDLFRQAMADGNAAPAREALALYRGDLLPQDRYDEWSEERREQLRLRRLELIRLDRQWAAVVETDPSDEVADLNLMRRHAADGDRHAAIRQFERLDRHHRRELGVAPGRDALAQRDRLRADRDATTRRDDAPIGRDRETAVVEHALLDSARGRSCTVLVSGPPGIGKSSLLAVASELAREMGFRIAHGTSSLVEGAWPNAPVVGALADLCRRHPTPLDGLRSAGTRSVRSARSCSPCPLPSRVRTPTTSSTPSDISQSPNDPECCGKARRGRPACPRRRPLSPPRAATACWHTT
jgi:DNA-binding SARP family transcriptional activator